MANVPKVFISSTNQDLSSSRDILRLAANDMDWMPVEQKHFPPDFRTLREMLRAKIKECDAVVVLVGFMYGSEPRLTPKSGERRSYTQWEFEFAVELKRPVFVFFCEEDYPFDCTPGEEPEELLKLQKEHRQRIVQSDRKRETIRNKSELSEKVRTLELFLSDARESKRKRGCAIRVSVVLTLCALLWMGVLLTEPSSSSPFEPPTYVVSSPPPPPNDSVTPPAGRPIEDEWLSPEPGNLPPTSPSTGPQPYKPPVVSGRIPVATASSGTGSDKPANTTNLEMLGHYVRPGETFYSIARSYGVLVADLISANPGIDPKLLPVGAKLMIPKKGAITTSTGDYPLAEKTNVPGRVKSPYPPHRELDVEGLKEGDLALDPTTNKVFRVP